MTVWRGGDPTPKQHGDHPLAGVPETRRSSARIGQYSAQLAEEAVILLGGADRDTQVSRKAEDVAGSDDDTAAEQAFVDGPAVLLHVDQDEVRLGRRIREAHGVECRCQGGL